MVGVWMVERSGGGLGDEARGGVIGLRADEVLAGELLLGGIGVE
jgi:hypothetical protein